MDKLEEILIKRRARLASAKEKCSLKDLEAMAASSPAPFDFTGAVSVPGRISVIAEMKRQSPSAGMIRPDYDVEEIAKAYEKGEAAAISVLTETDQFGGDVEHLSQVRRVSKIPILKKDFIFDVYQVVEARLKRADAVLLIADMLSPQDLNELAACARQYSLAALVEVFTPEALPSALKSGSKLIGVNSRNLRTLEMKPGNVTRLCGLIPEECTIVAESGIKDAADMQKLKSLPVSAVLVGESFLRQFDLAAAVNRLVTAGVR